MADATGNGSPSNDIQLKEHQLTREEVVPVVHWQQTRTWHIYILPVSGLCLVIAGALVLGADRSDTVAWTVMLTIGIVLLVIFAILVPLTPSRIWKRVEPQFEVRTLQVSEEGIRRVTVLSDGTMKWPMFSETSERGDMYLLKVAKGHGFFMIPRRAFASELDEAAFCALAKRHTTAHLHSVG